MIAIVVMIATIIKKGKGKGNNNTSLILHKFLQYLYNRKLRSHIQSPKAKQDKGIKLINA